MAEKEEFTDISGKTIKLSCQNYSPFCREFTISSAKLSLGRVMAFTCTVWLLAYTAFYLTQVRSGVIILTIIRFYLHICPVCIVQDLYIHLYIHICSHNDTVVKEYGEMNEPFCSEII